MSKGGERAAGKRKKTDQLRINLTIPREDACEIKRCLREYDE